MKTSLVSKIGLGTVQFGLDYGINNSQGITPKSEVQIILDLAQNYGINLIDTAFGYGRSEEVLGQVGVKSFRIVSKFLPATNQFSIADQINASLQKLKVNSIYGLLAHRPLNIVKKPEIWEYLIQLKLDGKVQKIGFSFNTLDEVNQIVKKKFVPDLIQVPYNYLDNRFEPYIIDFKNHGCEIHTRSAFLQGLFFMNPVTLNSFFDDVKPLLYKLQEYKEDLSGMLLRHCISKTFIDKVLIGVNNSTQLIEILVSLKSNKKLPELTIPIKNKILSPMDWLINE